MTLSELEIKPFKIEVSFNNKLYKFVITQSKLTNQIEEFSAVLNDKSIVITSNRPWIRLFDPRKKVLWKIQKPEMHVMVRTKSSSFVEDVFKQIKSVVAKSEQLGIDWNSHPKNQ